MALDGVVLAQSGDVTLVTVSSLSDELKDCIRQRLSEICWGPVVNGHRLAPHSYSATVRSLWRRISKKAENTRLGMAGELLTHIFLAEAEGMSSVNRMFNLEEASIKKGFDLVLFAEDEPFRFVEVKSGEVTKGSVVEKFRDLARLARSDLEGKLNSPAENLWDNAMNHCRSSLADGSFKQNVESILGEVWQESIEGGLTSKDYDVVLACVSFTCGNKFCVDSELSTFFDDIKASDKFNQVSVFLSQKNTLKAVLDFIKEEAEG